MGSTGACLPASRSRRALLPGHPSAVGRLCSSEFLLCSEPGAPHLVPALAPLGAVEAPGKSVTASLVRAAKTWGPEETLLYLLGLPPDSFPPQPSWGHTHQHAGGPLGEPEGPKARRSFAQMLSLWKCRVSSQAPCGGLGQTRRPQPSRWATQASGLLTCD